MDIANNLLGKWFLIDDDRDNFEDFLKYVGRNLIVRKIAKVCNIYLELKKKDNGYIKSVGTSFYSTDDYIEIDNVFRTYHNNDLEAKFYIKDNKVYTDNITKRYKWTEITHYEKPYLVVVYEWIENDKQKTMKLRFTEHQ